MKFTTTALLAALATVSSSAAVPSAIITGEPLPPKFTLKFTPVTRGSLVDRFQSQIIVGSTQLNIPISSINSDDHGQIPVALYKTENNGAYVQNTDGLGNWTMFINPANGQIQFGGSEEWADPGFVQVNGALAFDHHDGKGALNLWSTCNWVSDPHLWGVFFNPKPLLFQDPCYPITLSVVPL